MGFISMLLKNKSKAFMKGTFPLSLISKANSASADLRGFNQRPFDSVRYRTSGIEHKVNNTGISYSGSIIIQI